MKGRERWRGVWLIVQDLGVWEVTAAFVLVFVVIGAVRSCG